MNCPECQREMRPEDKYCPGCGLRRPQPLPGAASTVRAIPDGLLVDRARQLVSRALETHFLKADRNKRAAIIICGIYLLFSALLMLMSAEVRADYFGVLAFLAVGTLVLGGYFLPTILAMRRKVRHEAGIRVLNFFLGWTFIGWVAALIWAVSDAEIEQPKRP